MVTGLGHVNHMPGNDLPKEISTFKCNHNLGSCRRAMSPARLGIQIGVFYVLLIVRCGQDQHHCAPKSKWLSVCVSPCPAFAGRRLEWTLSFNGPCPPPTHEGRCILRSSPGGLQVAPCAINGLSNASSLQGLDMDFLRI